MKISIQEKGDTFFAEAQNVRGVIWIHYQGRTFVYEPDSQSKRIKSNATANGLMNAPMPGKVTRILKSVGDPVRIGEIVLVMEAMKMEYTLKSQIDGTLKLLECQVGEQVPLGKKLALIEASV